MSSIQSAQKQTSDESKGGSSEAGQPAGTRDSKFIKPLQLLRHGSSQALSGSAGGGGPVGLNGPELARTPSSGGGMRRVPSVWGTALGPQFQNSLLQGLASGAPAQMTTPQSIDLNNFL